MWTGHKRLALACIQLPQYYARTLFFEREPEGGGAGQCPPKKFGPSKICERKIVQAEPWGEKSSMCFLLISARPQRQTNAEVCRIFGDLDQLKSEDTIHKMVDWSPRPGEEKKNSSEIKTSTIYLQYCTCFNFTAVLLSFPLFAVGISLPFFV